MNIDDTIYPDFASVFFGKAHNIGAGGVHATACGYANYPGCGMCISWYLSEKRKEQMYKRHRRAFGTNLY